NRAASDDAAPTSTAQAGDQAAADDADDEEGVMGDMLDRLAPRPAPERTPEQTPGEAAEDGTTPTPRPVQADDARSPAIAPTSRSNIPVLDPRIVGVAPDMPQPQLRRE